MKKFTLVLLSLLTLLPLGAWAGTYYYDGVTYTYTPGETTAAVTTINTTATVVVIPSIINVGEGGDTNLRNVTSITAGACNGCTKLRTLTIGENVVTIDADIFKDCSSLQTLVIENTSILSELTINFTTSSLNTTLCIVSKGVKYYHQGSWSDANHHFSVGNGQNGNGFHSSSADGSNLQVLEKVCKIPVTEISNNAFYEIATDYNLSLPKSITTISDISFLRNGLKSITVATENADFKSTDGVLFSKDGKTLIAFPIKKGDTYNIPEGVTTIGANAFQGHFTLTEISIPASVTTIGQSAFQYTGKDANSLSVTGGSKILTIGNNAFQESGLSSITLPSTIKTIGASAFKSCTQLSNINFPASLESIGTNAFGGCNKLTTLTFASSYTNLNIGGSAFYNCKLSNSITIPEGVTTIGSNAFNRDGSFEDSSLKEIYLPASASFSSNIVNSYVEIYRKINMDFSGTWTTYYSNIELELPTGWAGYTVTAVNGNEIQTTPLHYIHKEKPVLLKLGDAPADGYFKMANNTAIALDENVVFKPELFIGTSKPITNFSSLQGDKYVLDGTSGNFIKSNQGTFPAFRCYIQLSSDNNTTLYVKDGNADPNTFIFFEEGTQIDTSKKTLGSVTVSSGELTVTPASGYYINKEDITVKRNVSATKGRAQLVNENLTLTKNSGDDPSATQTYTFTPTSGSSYEVAVNFHKRKNLSETSITKTVTLSASNFTYDGTEHKPTITTLTYGGSALTVVTDYVYSWVDNVNAGTGKVRITGKGEYTGSYDVDFAIARRDINHTNISVSSIDDTGFIYKGTAYEPRPTITDNVSINSVSTNIISESDYTISYKDNINAGTNTAEVIIKANDLNYSGQRSVKFTISPKSSKELTITIPDQLYTGSEIKPVPIIKDGDIEVPSTNYTIVYDNNIAQSDTVPTATITFINNYTGSSRTVHFCIKDEIGYRTLNVKFDENNKYQTYYWNENLKKPEGLKVYVVTGHQVGNPELNLKEVDFIPKNTAVILECENTSLAAFTANTYATDETPSLPEGITPNKTLFDGSMEATEIKSNKFILYQDKFVQTTEGILPANRCWIDYGKDDIGDNVTYVVVGENNSGIVILDEQGKVNAKAGIVTKSIEGTKCTLTVIPSSGYYATKDEISIIRNVEASKGRAQAVETNVTVTPASTYADPTGETTYTYDIVAGEQYQVVVQFQKPKDIIKSGVKITLDQTRFAYTGEEKKPQIISVTAGNTNLIENYDYTISYEDNINAGGSAKAVITGKGRYTNKTWQTFNIDRRNFNSVTLKIEDQVYTGFEIKPRLEVIDVIDAEKNQKINVEATDYALEWRNNVNVGTATVFVNADGEGAKKNYTGNKSTTFQILPKDLTVEGNEPTISGVEKKVYDGNPKELDLLIKDGVQTLENGKDYDVTYIDNVEVGTATANITFKGNYKGEIRKEFDIYFVSTPKEITINFEGENEWTTYYSNVNMEVPEGLKVYAVTGVNTAKGIILSTKEISFIPKNIGVLIQRTDKTKKDFTGMTMLSDTKLEEVTPDETHFLGTTAGIEDFSMIEGVKYILKDDQFVQAVDGTLQPNRCYILLSEKEAENIEAVDGSKDDIIVEQEGKTNADAGEVLLSNVDSEGFKTIQVSPANVLYVTKDEIIVLRYIGANGAFSRRRVPGVDSTPVEIVPVDPNADPSKTTKYKFKYDSQYNYQIIVDFQKRVNLSDTKISNPVVTLKATDIANLEYDGKEKKPTVESVTCNGVKVDPSNFDITYENNINAGTPRVIITGKRFLMGSTHAEFSIGKRDFANVKVIEPIPDHEYTGSPVEPVNIVLEDIVDGKNIVSASDCIFDCKNNIEIGTATFSILPKNNYYGSGKGPFTFQIVEPTAIGKVTVDDLDGQWFDLNGQRIQGKPTQKGIYILRTKNQKTVKVRVK